MWVSILNTLPIDSLICLKTFTSYSSIGNSLSLTQTEIEETFSMEGLKNGSHGLIEREWSPYKPWAFLKHSIENIFGIEAYQEEPIS